MQEKNANTKLICFGICENDRKYYHDLNKNYNFNLNFCDSYNIEKNMNLLNECDAILIRENVFLTKNVLNKLKEKNIKYILTQTAGIDHIDLEYARKLNFHSIQNVPNYSPLAVSEIALTLALINLKKINFSNLNWKFNNKLLLKDLKDLNVGIVGTGKIGYTTAKLFHSLGANILGYDIYKNDDFTKIGKYMSLKEVFINSDIISLHIPFNKKTKHLINKDLLDVAKKDLVLVNTARGQIINTSDIINFLKNNSEATFGTDVLENEDVFVDDKLKINEELKKLINLYPQVLITPHIGSCTIRALKDKIEISFDNLNNCINNKNLKNNIL